MTAKTTATAGKTVAKPATARTSGKAAKTTPSKLTAAQKHTAHVKHEQHVAHEAHLTAIGKAPKVALAVGDWLPVCAFEAVAQSLRLAGRRVDPDDVGQLWTLAGADPDGASIGDALAAAALFGLAGCRPVQFDRLQACRLPLGEAVAASVFVGADHAACAAHEQVIRRTTKETGHALILGIDVPGPHAVLATSDGWWSWGELHDPWPCRVGQAWAVSWS